MSCQADEVSPIVGIMLDGFPLYGPMQYFSPSSGKIYLNPENCDDCVLKQLEESDLDTCGGQEVADGNAHRHYELPVVLAGRVSDLNMGRYLDLRSTNAQESIANLYLKILNDAGSTLNSFGDDGINPLNI